MITYLTYIIQFFWSIPLVIGITRYKYLGRPAKVFMVYFVLCLFIEITARSLVNLGQSNHHVYKLMDYIIVSVFLVQRYFIDGLSTKLWAHFTLVICYVIWSVFFKISIEVWGGLDSFVYLLYASLLSALRINSLIKTEDELNEQEFWFYSGFLVFSFSASTLIYLHKYLKSDQTFHHYYHNIYMLLIVVSSGILFTKAMLCKPKVKTS